MTERTDHLMMALITRVAARATQVDSASKTYTGSPFSHYVDDTAGILLRTINNSCDLREHRELTR